MVLARHGEDNVAEHRNWLGAKKQETSNAAFSWFPPSLLVPSGPLPVGLDHVYSGQLFPPWLISETILIDTAMGAFYPGQVGHQE